MDSDLFQYGSDVRLDVLVYRFRHFALALLVRKLLWERVSAEQITAVMSGHGTEETERLFLGDAEIVFRAGRRSECAGALTGFSLLLFPVQLFRRTRQLIRIGYLKPCTSAQPMAICLKLCMRRGSGRVV